MSTPAYAKEQLKKIKEAIAAKEWDKVVSLAGRVTDFHLATPAGYQALVFQALAQFNLGRKNEAEELYMKAIDLQPAQLLARQGLAKFYEKEERWRDCVSVLDDIIRLGEPKPQIVEQYVDIVKAHMPRDIYLKTLERLLPSGDLCLDDAAPPRLSTYLELLSFYTQQDQAAIDSETRIRRQRLQAVSRSAKETEDSVKREVYGQSKVTDYLLLVAEHPDAPEDLRRETEEKLLNRWIDHLSITDNTPENETLKSDLLARIKKLATGMTMLKLKNTQAWQVVLEGDDSLFSSSSFDSHEWDLLHTFEDVYGDSQLASFLKLYEAIKSPKTEKDEEEDNVEAKPIEASEVLQAVDKTINSEFESWTLPCVLSLNLLFIPRILYSSDAIHGEWGTIIQLCKKARDLLDKKEAETGTTFVRTRTRLDTYEAVSLGFMDVSKNSSRINVIMNRLLGEGSSLTSPFMLASLYYIKGRVHEDEREWEAATLAYHSALRQLRAGNEKILVLHQSEHTDMKALNSLETDQSMLLFTKEQLKSTLTWCTFQNSQASGQNPDPVIIQEFSESIEAWKERSARGTDDELSALEERNNLDLAEAYWRLGELSVALSALYPSEKFPSPTSAYVTAIKISSSLFAPAFTSLGLYYYSKNDSERAKKCFHKAIELDGSQYQAAYHLARDYAEQNEWDLVEIIAKRVMGKLNGSRLKKQTRDENILWVYQALANSAMQRKDYPAAIKHFSLVITLDPSKIDSWIQLGVCYTRTGKYQSALKIFDHVLEVNPSQLHARVALGHLENTLGEYKVAIEHFLYALNEIPKHHHIRMLLITTYVTFGTELLQKCAQGYSEECLSEGLKHAAILIQDGYAPSLLWKLLGSLFEQLSQIHELIYSASIISSIAEIFAYLEKREWEQDIAEFDAVDFSTLREKDIMPGSYFKALMVLCFKAGVVFIDSDSSPSLVWYDFATALYRIRDDLNGLGFLRTSEQAFMQAFKGMKIALSYDSHATKCWNALGVMLFDRDARLSQHCFIRALEIDSRSHVAWSNLGLFYLSHEELEMAETALMRSHVLIPDYGPVWAGLYVLQKNKDRVAANTQSASDVKPAPAPFNGEDIVEKSEEEDSTTPGRASYRIIEHAFLVTTDMPELDLCYAAETFENYKKLLSSLENPYLSLAGVRVEQASLYLTRPRFALKRYLQRRPYCPCGLNLYALVLEQFGETELALEAAEQAAEILEQQYDVEESANVEMYYTIAQVNTGRLRLSLKRYEDSIEAFDAAQSLVDDSIQDAIRRLRSRVSSSKMNPGSLLSYSRATPSSGWSDNTTPSSSTKYDLGQGVSHIDIFRIKIEAVLGQALAYYHMGESSKAIQLLEEGLDELEVLHEWQTDSLSVALCRIHWSEDDEDRALSALLDGGNVPSIATRGDTPHYRLLIAHAFAIMTSDKPLMAHAENVSHKSPSYRYHKGATRLFYLQKLLQHDYRGALAALSSRLFAAPWRKWYKRQINIALVLDLPEIGGDMTKPRSAPITIPYPNLSMLERLNGKMLCDPGESSDMRGHHNRVKSVCALNYGHVEQAVSEVQRAIFVEPWTGYYWKCLPIIASHSIKRINMPKDVNMRFDMRNAIPPTD